MPEPSEPSLQPSPLAAGIAGLAASEPHRLAIVDRHSSLDYGEVDARSARLAAEATERTRDQAWTPVLTTRSSAAVIGIVALQRAGIPFVPLERDEPLERLHETFARLGSPRVAIVPDEESAAVLPPGTEPLLVPTTGGPAFEPRPLVPDEAGAILFTSGSTGRPKGVVRTWRSYLRAGPDYRQRAADGHVDRIALLRPLNYGSAMNMLVALAHGHSLHILDPRTVDPDGLVEWLRAERITLGNFGPGIGAAITQSSARPHSIPDLRVIRMGGQATSCELLGRLRELASPDAEIRVHYSSTEAGPVFQHRIGPGEPVGTGTAPIGRPIDPGRIRLDPVEGGPGLSELLVADPAALEYFEDPELTRARLITDEAGRRWWRSGDVVTVDDEGVFHHRGRLDDMVKINGFRVEPAEVEEVLNTVEGVRIAAAVVHTSGPGAPRLVGHVVLDDAELTPDRLRAALGARLPAHLVPTAFILHPSLPLTERSKIDRAALREAPVEPWVARSTPALTGPLDPKVEWVCAQLSRQLGLPRVGPADDVWQIGLDSLGALELAAALAAAGIGRVDPTRLLDHRTPTRIVELAVADAHGSEHPAVVMNPEGSRQAIVAIPGGGGSAFEFRSLAADLGPDQPLAVIEPLGMHRPGRVDRTLEQMVTTALAECARLDRGEPWTVLGYSAGGPLSYELARRLRDTGRDVHLVLLDTTPWHPKTRRLLLPDPARPPERDTLAARLRRLPQSLTRRWFLLRPGPPRHHRLRYDAFSLMLKRATAGYRPERVPFDATLVHRADTRAFVGATAPLVGSLRSIEVDGDHFSMLHPPHHAPIVDAIRVVVEGDASPLSA